MFMLGQDWQRFLGTALALKNCAIGALINASLTPWCSTQFPILRTNIGGEHLKLTRLPLCKNNKSFDTLYIRASRSNMCHATVTCIAVMIIYRLMWTHLLAQQGIPTNTMNLTSVAKQRFTVKNTSLPLADAFT